MSDVISLPRYRRGIAMLDAAALMGAGPMTEDDAHDAREEPMPTKPAATKPTSVRLRPEQVEALDRLAPALTALRPEVAALAGGELGPYSLLRLAIALGLAELERMAAPPAPPRPLPGWVPYQDEAAGGFDRGAAPRKAAAAMVARALDAGWTVPRLAEEIGINAAAVEQVARGRRGLSRTATNSLEALLAVCGA